MAVDERDYPYWIKLAYQTGDLAPGADLHANAELQAKFVAAAVRQPTE